jgi:hypothetical protein
MQLVVLLRKVRIIIAWLKLPSKSMKPIAPLKNYDWFSLFSINCMVLCFGAPLKVPVEGISNNLHVLFHVNSRYF